MGSLTFQSTQKVKKREQNYSVRRNWKINFRGQPGRRHQHPTREERERAAGIGNGKERRASKVGR